MFNVLLYYLHCTLNIQFWQNSHWLTVTANSLIILKGGKAINTVPWTTPTFAFCRILPTNIIRLPGDHHFSSGKGEVVEFYQQPYWRDKKSLRTFYNESLTVGSNMMNISELLQRNTQSTTWVFVGSADEHDATRLTFFPFPYHFPEHSTLRMLPGTLAKSWHQLEDMCSTVDPQGSVRGSFAESEESPSFTVLTSQKGSKCLVVCLLDLSLSTRFGGSLVTWLQSTRKYLRGVGLETRPRPKLDMAIWIHIWDNPQRDSAEVGTINCHIPFVPGSLNQAECWLCSVRLQDLLISMG